MKTFLNALRPTHGLKWGVSVTLIAATYFVAGRFGQTFASLSGGVTPVWPPSGIALAAVMLLGYRIWPGIWIGSMVSNVWLNNVSLAITSKVSLVAIGATAMVGLGDSCEAVLGAYLFRLLVQDEQPFERAKNVAWFVFSTAVVSCMVNATVGVTGLCLGGFAAWSNFGITWLTWWLGDAAGVLVVTPVILAWKPKTFYLPKPTWKQAEATLLFGLLFVVGGLIFNSGYPLEYLFIPMLVWTVFRFGHREVTAASLVVSGIMTWGTVHGYGSFTGRSQNESLLLLQGFIVAVMLTTLLLAAVRAERQDAEARLEAYSRTLEEKVEQRTSELQAANADLAEALIEAKHNRRVAEDANRLKTELLEMVAHDLKNPLQSVMGFSQIIKEEKPDETETNQFLGNIYKAAQEMLRQVNTLLKNAASASLSFSLNKEPQNIAVLAKRITDRNRPQANTKRQTLDFTATTDGIAFVDADRIQDAFDNLISNAIKFSPLGTTIYIRVTEQADTVRFEVQDEGQGLTPEDLQKLFGRFQRLSAKPTGGEHSTGLGLSIVKQIIEQHQGKIWSESAGKGKGSTFFIELPIVRD